MHEIYPWQQKQWQEFLIRKNSDRLPHAYLLTGNKGLGKHSFAKAMAKQVLCANTSNNNTCNNCHSCKLFDSDNHPDYYIVTPEQQGKGIKVGQIRNIINSVTQKPQISGYQVVLIEPADSMNIAASNALLKTLEEPLGQVLFILIATNAANLTATINSRCQKVPFYSPPYEVAKNWLSDKQINENELRLALKLAENAPLQVLKLLQENTLEEYSNILINIIKVINKNLDPISFAKDYSKVELTNILSYWQILLLDLLKIKLSHNPKDSDIININNIEALQNLAISAKPENLHNCLDKITGLKKTIGNNPNTQLLLEDLAIFITNELNNVS